MSKVKRTAAIIGLILIVSMYLISFLSALFATEYSYGLFMASIFCTIVIPIMIYLFIAVYKMVHRKDEPQE
ncbi:MAG: putative rane protein [Herbinix sp.]|jgi:dolichyl-phosphate-mannose--protein O-mannosyl transferase|nr:putative rane protein [Herbinix sp.]